jgi:hypothetical protein
VKLSTISKYEAILREGLDGGTVFDFDVSIDDMLARSSV